MKISLIERCEDMKKSYKNMKDNNNKKASTGRGQISWKYVNTFEHIC